MTTTTETAFVNLHGVACETRILTRDDFTWDAYVSFNGRGFRSVGFGQENSRERAEAAARSARDLATAARRSA